MIVADLGFILTTPQYFLLISYVLYKLIQMIYDVFNNQHSVVKV